MLDKEDMDRLREIFVTRQDCTNQMDAVSERLSKGNERFAKIETQLALITKLLYFIGGGIITLILGGLWNLIAK
jgi:hypothetical protein